MNRLQRRLSSGRGDSPRERALSRFILAWGTALLIAGCAPKAGKEQHFGGPFTQAQTATIGQLLDTPDAFLRKPLRVKGTIERQCPVAGCWFFINDGQGHSIKIELGDYFDKLPQNIGSTAEAEGEWIKKGDSYEFIGTRVTFAKKEAP